MHRQFLLIRILVGCLLAVSACAAPQIEERARPREEALIHAIETRAANALVEGEGIVTKILPDDNSGARHQRFIVRLRPGQTLLISHNIDLAPRVTSLREGDTVTFSGKYEWNARGGVVHWTHRDPAGRQHGGWLRHNGNTYQ